MRLPVLPIARVALVALGLPALAVATPASAQSTKDSVVIGMTLEPPGLDPTTGAAAAIGEIVHYNLFEGLTKINADGSVTPLLADSWKISDDGKTYTFKLKSGVKFQDSEPMSSADVKFTFEKAARPDSTNKQKAFYQTITAIETQDPQTVALTLKDPNPDALFLLGLNTGVIVSPKSAATNASKPVGTGPFRLEAWNKGSSVTLAKWDGYRDAGAIALKKATFRIINDSAAQVTALLTGDIDAFPRFGSVQNVDQFKGDGRYVVSVGGTEGKTILAINNKRKPLDDVRVRRAIAAAIDRRLLIDGAMNGYGAPIGSHYVPGDEGYIDLTGVSPYDPEKAKALLKEAGVTSLNLTLTLPPPAYARQGGEIIAAQLADIGVTAKIENVEWAQWLSGAFTNKNYDLTIISHVEPLDLSNYANPNYYWQYDSQAFRDIMAKIGAAKSKDERITLLQDAQRKLADDAVNGFLFQLQQITVAKKELAGLWTRSPIFVNDLTGVRWR